MQVQIKFIYLHNLRLKKSYNFALSDCAIHSSHFIADLKIFFVSRDCSTIAT